MAQPTEAQVRALERAHKNQFVMLVGAAKFNQTLSKNYAWLPNTDYRKKAFLKFGTEFIPVLAKWIMRQENLERAGIPKMPVVVRDFFSRDRMPYLEELVRSINAETQVNGQMGFIPLIIWGVIAIAAIFGATEIVDETNTTAEERQDLMATSSKTCTDLKLTPEQCAQMINTAQTEATTSGSGIGIMGWIALAAAGFFLMKNQNKKTAA
jgi:hypothetical protein